MAYLTQAQKEKITEQLNPAGSNYKSCNFFKVLNEDKDGYRVEVGYWITYIGCRPKYEKTVVFLKK